MFKRRLRSGRKGTATVEMAMVAPVIFLMVFGSIEFARMMMVRQSFTNSIREGCRKACLVTTLESSDAETTVRDAINGVIANSDTNEDIRITFDPAFTTAPPSGTEITATIEIDCADASFLPPMFTGEAKIRCSCTMIRD